MTLQINTFNARGLANSNKRRTIFQWLKTFHRGIVMLQETHSHASTEKIWNRDWDGEIFFSHGTTQARGVAILFPAGFDPEIHNTITDENGRFIIINATIQECEVVFVNIYAPTKDNENGQIDLINLLSERLLEFGDKNIIIGGDFNVCLNPTLDKSGGKDEKVSKYALNISDF